MNGDDGSGDEVMTVVLMRGDDDIGDERWWC